MQFLYEHCSLIFGGEAALKQYPCLSIAAKTTAEDSNGRTVHLQCFAWLWKFFGTALQSMAAQYNQVLKELLVEFTFDDNPALYYIRLFPK